jgi:hypothetical protein
VTHDDLAEDLATHLRGGVAGLVWTDMQMGSSGSPRPDVWVMPTTYSTFRPISYEVKVSRADFLADVTAGKWQSYLKFSAGVIFACEAGLLKPADLPAGTGLIERHASGLWRHRKRATLRHVDNLPINVWQKLVMDGVHRAQGRLFKAAATEYALHASMRKRVGEEVAKVVSDTARAVHYLGHLEEEAKKLREKHERELEEHRAELDRVRRESIDPQLAILARELGLNDYAMGSYWRLVAAVREAKERLSADSRLDRVRAHLRHIQSELKRADDALALEAPDEAQEGVV